MNLQMISKLEIFFSFCDMHNFSVGLQNTFSIDPFTLQINVIDDSMEDELVLTLKLYGLRSEIALRVCQTMRPECIFGVVGSFFFVNNHLSLSCILPNELDAEDWYRILKYQQAYMLSFLS